MSELQRYEISLGKAWTTDHGLEKWYKVEEVDAEITRLKSLMRAVVDSWYSKFPAEAVLMITDRAMDALRSEVQ